MYQVSAAFLSAVKANTRKYYWTGRITAKVGVVHEFDQNDIVVSYLNITGWRRVIYDSFSHFKIQFFTSHFLFLKAQRLHKPRNSHKTTLFHHIIPTENQADKTEK